MTVNSSIQLVPESLIDSSDVIKNFLADEQNIAEKPGKPLFCQIIAFFAPGTWWSVLLIPTVCRQPFLIYWKSLLVSVYIGTKKLHPSKTLLVKIVYLTCRSSRLQKAELSMRSKLPSWMLASRTKLYYVQLYSFLRIFFASWLSSTNLGAQNRFVFYPSTLIVSKKVLTTVNMHRSCAQSLRAIDIRSS